MGKLNILRFKNGSSIALATGNADSWKGANPRRHHNRNGYRQIKNGKPEKQMRALARKLGIPYGFKFMSLIPAGDIR